ncbi:ROK family protein [Granulosicoccus sp. 3-233]|uniref:ROK family protein n=1 Tax=Granulosicoccus sp. 3-233 TaxID=3417969 RepID=UPI003D333B2B
MTFCFDIGGSKIVAAHVDDQGRIEERGRRATPVDDPSRFFKALKALCPEGDEAVGIAIAGVIEPQSGQLTSANIPGISGLRLAEELQVRLRRPVFLLNDADAFALAEARWGAASGHASVMAIILGTGVGGAIVLNGRLHVGQAGLSGEWGHGPASAMRTGESLPILTCLCGQTGCVDTLGGARGLERLYLHAYRTSLDSVSIVNAWQSGDAMATRIVDLWLDIVGGALAAAVNLIGPSVVPVGGGLARSQELISALDQEVRRRSLVRQETSLLYPTASGPEQGLAGAAWMVQQRLSGIAS